jgi:hypothetical protein
MALSLAELKGHHPVEAIQHLREYIGRSDVPAAKIDLARTKWLPLAVAQTARLDVFARPDAEIRVDGVVADRAPRPTENSAIPGDPLAASIVIAAGEHEVSVRDGTLAQSQHILANSGEVVEVHFQRVPDAQPPAATSTLPSTVILPRDSGHSNTSTRAKWITVLGLESAAVVAAGVAIGFSVAVEITASKANGLVGLVYAETGGNSGCLGPSPAPQCPELSRDRQAEHANAAWANRFYAGAGALAVIGAASFFLWPSRQKPSAGALQPAPILGDRTAGAMLTGAW